MEFKDTTETQGTSLKAVDIETEWNLKAFKNPCQGHTDLRVDIETEWNLKQTTSTLPPANS